MKIGCLVIATTVMPYDFELDMCNLGLLTQKELPMEPRSTESCISFEESLPSGKHPTDESMKFGRKGN